MSQQKNTPLMEQYLSIKKEFPDTLLFFQVGDFYELFFDDAKIAASFLGIALTARGKQKGEPIALCGVPLHAIDHYLHKLVKGGYKVAICDQLEPPKAGAIVKRGITRVLTPGTLTESQLLDEKSPSYLLSFVPLDTGWGLACAELLTSQIFVTEIKKDNYKSLEAELSRFFPDELILPKEYAQQFSALFKKLGYFTTIIQDSDEPEVLKKTNMIAEQLEGDARHEAIRKALYYFYAYMSKTNRAVLDITPTISYYKADQFLQLDAATQLNLELIINQRGTREYTLLSVLDRAVTSMGSRMIKKWIQRPLVNRQAIIQRQELIALLIQETHCHHIIKQSLSRIGDLERVVGRIALMRAHLNDYLMLKRALKELPSIKKVLSTHDQYILCVVLNEHCQTFDELFKLLDQALSDMPEHNHIIKKGYDQELDVLRSFSYDASSNIVSLERAEQESTGINSLKVRFNQVHGYYIEITNTHKDKIPSRYVRQQTLVGRERFTTPELQKLQYAIQHAQQEFEQREQKLFEELKLKIANFIVPLRKCAYALSYLDALHGLSSAAQAYDYVCPSFNTSRDIIIKQGRHPVVEAALGQFVPNDTRLADDESIWIITGPNMGGKSTYLRQVALICIMAHIGSFVPTEAASLPIIDALFTRIGAGDNLAHGKSTFLVEMEETAHICAQATEQSLIILDEVGRGTSTFDGMSIAQAVIEYVHTQKRARCLFATHYHELTHLPEIFNGIVTYYAANRKTEEGIIFLYKMIKGVARGSFGIDVAELAQLPEWVVKRSRAILQNLSYEPAYIDKNEPLESVQPVNDNPIFTELQCLNLDDLTPKQAFDKLWEWKKQLKAH